MAKKRKNRTHLKGGAASGAPGADAGVPKSFVIKHGQVGSALAQLVRDVRKVMEPNTASRLKERSRNKLKDFLTMAPALGVTHLLAFTLAPVAPSLRIVRLPHGPTLSFRIERYSLAKDVLRASRHARAIGMEYLSPPLLVLASFPPPGPGTPPHLALLMTTFQSLFPPLSPKTLSLAAARRVVLVAYDAARGTLDVRHYVITVKPYGVSRRVRRVVEGGAARASAAPVLDLGNERDVADFVLRRRVEPGPGGDGYESAASDASSAAGDEADAAVSLASDYVGRNNKRGSRRAVRLDEVGPRMELRLVKIVEGVPGREGEVIYHEFVKKTKSEVAKQKAEHAAKEKLRKQRREEQERNVAKKKAEAGQAKGKGKGKQVTEDEDEEGDDEEDKEMESGGEDDVDQEEDDGDEDEEGADEDEGVWDEDEEVDDEDEDDASQSEESEESEPEEMPPPKKVKFRSKR